MACALADNRFPLLAPKGRSDKCGRAGLDTGSDQLLTAHQEDRGCPDLCGRISHQPLWRVLPRRRPLRALSGVPLFPYFAFTTN